ncbi:MAG: hypothetical protein ACP6IY_11020 [Promethearchaeia archaeon]
MEDILAKYKNRKSVFYCPCCGGAIEWSNICGPCPHCRLCGFADIKCKNCIYKKQCNTDLNDKCDKFTPRVIS